MTTYKTILNTALAALLALAVQAQETPAADEDIDSTYFHPAASMYIQGDTAGASTLVEQGLELYPENGKLLRLKELLEQQNQDQDQQNQDQDQQNQDQDQQNQDQDQQNQDQQDQNQNQNENQDQQDNQNQDQQDQNQDQQDQDNQDQQDQNQDQQPAEPPRAEQMSQDEAERLMDAMKQDEETKRLMLQPVRGAPVKVDKDW